MKLAKSDVIFDAANHTYSYEGRQLSGITSLLHRQLFPDMYAGISQEVLQNAADRGTLVHQNCELADEGFDVDTIEAINYLKLKAENNLAFEQSEYLVSDNEHYASCIDKVYREDDTTFSLGDIKTTYSLNKEYVTWQLSIYAYLFEKQNPGAKVSSIFAIWLRDEKAKLVRLERKSDEEVSSLLSCDSQGIQYNPKNESLPILAKEAEQMIVDIETQIKALEEQKDNLREGVMRAMVQAGLYSWKGEKVSITRKTASTRKTFDAKRFEKEHPELYNQYVKETLTSEVLQIKIK
jgi:hypothetical protein